MNIREEDRAKQGSFSGKNWHLNIEPGSESTFAPDDRLKWMQDRAMKIRPKGTSIEVRGLNIIVLVSTPPKLQGETETTTNFLNSESKGEAI